MPKNQSKSYLRETAILCLAAICITAALKGIDTGLIAGIAALIAGIAGYTIRKARK